MQYTAGNAEAYSEHDRNNCYCLQVANMPEHMVYTAQPLHNGSLQKQGSGLWALDPRGDVDSDCRTVLARRDSAGGSGLCGRCYITGRAQHYAQPEHAHQWFNGEVDLRTNGGPLACVPLKDFRGSVFAVLQVGEVS
jgi:hypothetical protein